jgi:hypothetical protein
MKLTTLTVLAAALISPASSLAQDFADRAEIDRYISLVIMPEIRIANERAIAKRDANEWAANNTNRTVTQPVRLAEFSFTVLNDLTKYSDHIIIENRTGLDIDKVVITVVAKSDTEKEYKTYTFTGIPSEVMSGNYYSKNASWYVPFATHLFDKNGNNPVSNRMLVIKVSVDASSIATEKLLGEKLAKLNTWTKTVQSVE